MKKRLIIRMLVLIISIKKLSESMNVPIHYDGVGSAFYRPSTDDIHLPRPESFYSSAEFNGTALHELAHSTGHPTRLNRDIKNLFGSENYAFEELVAEMTSCFMSANLQDVDIGSFNRFGKQCVSSVMDRGDSE